MESATNFPLNSLNVALSLNLANYFVLACVCAVFVCAQCLYSNHRTGIYHISMGVYV